MRVLLSTTGEEVFAFECTQLVSILAWPLTLDIPWRPLRALAGLDDGPDPEPRVLLARSAASGLSFAVRVPGPLREEDVVDAEIHPLPALLQAPPWVRGLAPRGGLPALLLDLPLLGDAVVSQSQLPSEDYP